MGCPVKAHEFLNIGKTQLAPNMNPGQIKEKMNCNNTIVKYLQTNKKQVSNEVVFIFNNQINSSEHC